MLSKALSGRYTKRINPRWSGVFSQGVVKSVANMRSDPSVSKPLAIMLNDLLFSEVWLDRVCNTASSVSGAQVASCLPALSQLYSGSEKINELFETIRQFKIPALDKEVDNIISQLVTNQAVK